MFKKLNLSLSTIDIANIKGNSEYDRPTFKQFSILERQHLVDVLSSKIRFAIPPHEINITEILYPGVLSLIQIRGQLLLIFILMLQTMKLVFGKKLIRPTLLCKIVILRLAIFRI